MGNKTKEKEIEGVDSETEGMDSDNEGVYNELLPTYQKCFSLGNPPNVNYRNKKASRSSMGWKNLIIISN